MTITSSDELEKIIVEVTQSVGEHIVEIYSGSQPHKLRETIFGYENACVLVIGCRRIYVQHFFGFSEHEEYVSFSSRRIKEAPLSKAEINALTNILNITGIEASVSPLEINFKTRPLKGEVRSAFYNYLVAEQRVYRTTKEYLDALEKLR
ncbi:hypothetical protein J4455_05615 [Candidatus Woesearchaeota archaeon]|nr:hypothetical protein [uncultured archaeon]MBS3150132.1 hypothetical protein [Candidatus Woesearchaeota archaeon]